MQAREQANEEGKSECAHALTTVEKEAAGPRTKNDFYFFHQSTRLFARSMRWQIGKLAADKKGKKYHHSWFMRSKYKFIVQT